MGNCGLSPRARETEEELSNRAFAVCTLSSIAIFSRLQEEDLEVEECQFMAGEDIVVQGDENTDLIYILRSGSCDVSIGGSVVNNLGRASVIGERAFIAQKSRSATVTATEQCSVLAISRLSLEKALGFDSYNPTELSEEEIVAEKLRRLAQFPLLAPMTDAYLKELASDMEIKQYLPNEPIIIKGTVGKEFFFIDRGCVDIVDKGPEEIMNMAGMGIADGDAASASPSSISLSLKSPSSTSSSVRSPSSKMNFNVPVQSNTASPLTSIPMINFGADADDEDEDDGDNDSEEKEGGKGVATAEADAGQEKPTAAAAAAAAAAVNNGENETVQSPVHDDVAEAINNGVNDFLMHYESARMKSLGGLIKDLKKVSSGGGSSGSGSGSGKRAAKYRAKKNNGPATSVAVLPSSDIKATLRAGQFFGEMALMEEGEDGRRTATCLARTHCTLLAMQKAPFLRLMDILNGN
jgi:CRP-like cAMP-binding protein